MQRMLLVMFALFAGILLCGASLARAQSPPGGPTVAPPPGQHPPRDNGIKPPPASLPREILTAPHNGPGVPPPPGFAVPRNQQEATALAANPALLQAARQAQTQAQPQVDIARQMAQRVARGDHTLPTDAERRAVAGQGYSPSGTGHVPPGLPPGSTPHPPRSETPVERVMHLLGLDSLAHPAESSSAQPDDEPSLQPPSQDIPIGACALYPLLWESTDYQYNEDIFYGETFHTCAYLPVGSPGIWYMTTEQFLYACPWFISWLNICMGEPYYVTEFIPGCYEYYPPQSYQWCGPRVWYPPDVGKGYKLRSYGSIWLFNGAFGQGYRDGPWMPYKCGEHRYFDSCS